MINWQSYLEHRAFWLFFTPSLLSLNNSASHFWKSQSDEVAIITSFHLLYSPPPYLANALFIFGLQLALLAADDFARLIGFEIMVSVALQFIFLVVTSVILLKMSYSLCPHN